MKAVNLYLLTRTHDHVGLSMLLKALSGTRELKEVSPHEAATLWTLTDKITEYIYDHRELFPDDWPHLLDGFFFSFVIRHIGKEFDLLKISADGGYVLNIELKSEKVEEDKIRKQLEQNRYYLSHVAHTIYSFTYVMETDQFYTMNDNGTLRMCGIEELIAVILDKSLEIFLKEEIGKLFRTAEYLISPIADPEKFVKGKYFLTNQQFEFRKRILSYTEDPASENGQNVVISISGTAGTGKTLLLLDLAVYYSGFGDVLFIHSGPLRRGHIELSMQLPGVSIVSGTRACGKLEGYICILADEADHLETEVLDRLLKEAGDGHIPVILAYDPHRLLHHGESETADEGTSQTVRLIETLSSLKLAFTGNIRINRPVYSFLRSLLNRKDMAARPDYGCIDVLYTANDRELKLFEDYYRDEGYVLISMSDGAEKEDDIIAREYDRIIMVLDDTFYYDEAMHLRVRENEETSLRLIYEGLSRTKESLCLLISGNRELFMKILAIKVEQALSQ